MTEPSAPPPAAELHTETWKPVYHRCPRHGDQGQVVGISLLIDAAPLKPLKRKYCMECFADMLDANCCQLIEVPAPVTEQTDER